MRQRLFSAGWVNRRAKRPTTEAAAPQRWVKYRCWLAWTQAGWATLVWSLFHSRPLPLPTSICYVGECYDCSWTVLALVPIYNIFLGMYEGVYIVPAHQPAAGQLSPQVFRMLPDVLHLYGIPFMKVHQHVFTNTWNHTNMSASIQTTRCLELRCMYDLERPQMEPLQQLTCLTTITAGGVMGRLGLLSDFGGWGSGRSQGAAALAHHPLDQALHWLLGGYAAAALDQSCWDLELPVLPAHQLMMPCRARKTAAQPHSQPYCSKLPVPPPRSGAEELPGLGQLLVTPAKLPVACSVQAEMGSCCQQGV